MGKLRSKLNKLPPFVALTWELLNSVAYKELTPSAAKALPYFLGKVKVGYNDPEKYTRTFSFPYSEAEQLGFSTATFSRVVKELVKIGFIEFTEKGGLRGEELSYNKYRLSKKWKSYVKEQPATHKPTPCAIAPHAGTDDKPVVRKKILKRTAQSAA